MLLVPCTTVKARRPMRYAGRDRFKASLDHTASSRQQSKKNLAKKLGREHTGVLKGSQARFHNHVWEYICTLIPSKILAQEASLMGPCLSCWDSGF